MYLIVSILLGGFLALFGSAGWSSYSTKKLPATPELFRWFVAGSLTAGLGSYAWMYGAGGDPSALLETIGDSLEMKDVVNTLTSSVGGAAAAAAAAGADTVQKVVEEASELTVGMPRF